MDVILQALAKNVLGNKAWTVDYVMIIGSELAQAVNKMPGLSGREKTELVCQTILKMLEDVEKVERERTEESIQKEKTIANLEECKKIVKTLLPVTLSLLVAASRGKILLQKAKKDGCFSALMACFSGSQVEKKKEVVPLPPSNQTEEHAGQSGQLAQEVPQVVLRIPEGVKGSGL